MIENFAEIKTQLAELATVLNTFKSEAVQLKLLDIILGEGFVPRAETTQRMAPTPAKRGGKTKNNNKGKDNSTPASKASAVAPVKRKGAASGAGANATLTQLLQTNFFEKPQTLNDIIVHCKHNMARTFKANEFSSKLGRLVRSNELTRKKNADNQYEYKKA